MLAAAYFATLIESVAEGDTPVEALYDLLRRALDWLHDHQPTRKAVLFFEKEVAGDLGIHGEADTSPIAEVRQNVLWGPGPRASQALMLASRARALLQGRLAPSVDDVLTLAKPVLQHRMALTFSARADGQSVHDIIAKLCAYANDI